MTDPIATNQAEMPALVLAAYLNRIRLSNSVRRLSALALEIEGRYPADGATPRLIAISTGKCARLGRANWMRAQRKGQKPTAGSPPRLSEE